MRSLSSLTGGLVGERDPAQPLLTLYDAPGRVELSGATTANWVAKSANLLVDGLGGPARVGLLLPLHWQPVALLLAAVATGAAVTVAAGPEELAGCDAAFVRAEATDAALRAGVPEVLALSGHPLGAPVAGPLDPRALDYAREVPSYGDHYSGPAPAAARITVEGRPLDPAAGSPLGLTAADRVLTRLAPGTRVGLHVLLAALAAGGSLLLVRDPAADLTGLAGVERATAVAGGDVPGLRRLDRPAS